MRINLSAERQQQVLQQVGTTTDYPSYVIEKVLLLHEELSIPIEKIRTDRLTRHLYDVEKLMDSSFGKSAFRDDNLFNTIVEHRKHVTPLRGLDYNNHTKGRLKIIPPKEIEESWEQDYKTMQENMIVGGSLPWEDLLKRIKEVQNGFNNQ